MNQKSSDDSKKIRQNVQPLRGLRSSKKHYLIFCKNNREFISFLSRNIYIKDQYKFVDFSLESSDGKPCILPTTEDIKREFGFENCTIRFLKGFTNQEYRDSIELAFMIANGMEIPDRLIPSTIKNMMSDE
jgi:hypothetical protein